MIVEIVVDAEILLVVDAVIKLYRELIAALGLHRDGHQRIAAGRSRNKLQQIDRVGSMQASGNDVAWEKIRIGAYRSGMIPPAA